MSKVCSIAAPSTLPSPRETTVLVHPQQRGRELRSTFLPRRHLRGESLARFSRLLSLAGAEARARGEDGGDDAGAAFAKQRAEVRSELLQGGVDVVAVSCGAEERLEDEVGGGMPGDGAHLPAEKSPENLAEYTPRRGANDRLEQVAPAATLDELLHV